MHFMKTLLKRTVRAARSRLSLPPENPTVVVLKRLALGGFEPHIVFDVGAHAGEFARTARQIWPAAQINCFEVLTNRVAELRALAARDGNIAVFPFLLGAEEKESILFHENETASSVFSDTCFHGFRSVVTHPMRTIDSLVASGVSAPQFIKIDVQGYDLEVLKGATRSLSSATLVLAEINTIEIYKGVPLAAEFIEWMGQHGWPMFDIGEVVHRPLDGAAWQFDCFFVPERSPLRSDKRYDAAAIPLDEARLH
jgi:FkbM family methyltransferase